MDLLPTYPIGRSHTIGRCGLHCRVSPCASDLSPELGAEIAFKLLAIATVVLGPELDTRSLSPDRIHAYITANVFILHARPGCIAGLLSALTNTFEILVDIDHSTSSCPDHIIVHHTRPSIKILTMYATTSAAALALASILSFTQAAVHTVDVGESGLTFKPETLNPAVGDTVVFKLYPQHDVVTGDFSSPCTPSSGGNASFFSGPFSGTDNGAKKFVVNVTTTQPVYYYCAVQRHCQQGMVGGWNLP